MTTTEQIQELQNAVTSLQSQISALSGQVTSNNTRINLDLLDKGDSIALLNSKASLLQNEDTDLHEEIHEVALEVDNHEGRINALEVGQEGNDLAISNLQQAHLDMQDDMNDMDVEHHEELHRLALAIDNHSSRLNNVEIFVEETPNFVVLSEDDYEALGTPDYDTFYYVYEEED